MKHSILILLSLFVLTTGCGGQNSRPIEPNNPSPPPGVEALKIKSSHGTSHRSIAEK
jgi:hypothetical protein